MHPGEGELEQPDEEEAQQLLGGDVRRGRDGVGPVGVGRAENAAEHDREEVSAIV